MRDEFKIFSGSSNRPLTEKIAQVLGVKVSECTLMIMHSIFDFNLHILSNMLLFALVPGMLSSLSISSEEKYHGRGSKRAASAKDEEYGNSTDPDAVTPDKVEDWERNQTSIMRAKVNR